jgi:hypothetical protein
MPDRLDAVLTEVLMVLQAQAARLDILDYFEARVSVLEADVMRLIGLVGTQVTQLAALQDRVQALENGQTSAVQEPQ